MTGAPKYLRAADVARLTGMSLRTIRRWIANEVLRSIKLGGGKLVARDDLARLLSPSSEADEKTDDHAE